MINFFKFSKFNLFELSFKQFNFNNYNFSENQVYFNKSFIRFLIKRQYKRRQTFNKKMNLVFKVFKENN